MINGMTNYRILLSKDSADIPAIYEYLMTHRAYYIRLTILSSILTISASIFCYILSNTSHVALTLLAIAAINIGMVAVLLNFCVYRSWDYYQPSLA